MRQWWTNNTISEYINRTQCFIKQYDEYYIPEVEEHVRYEILFYIHQLFKNLISNLAFYSMQIDGELTLGENIADNGGLREAFYAYKLYTDKYGEEPLLPGFENFSHEQLLFISFGNVRRFRNISQRSIFNFCFFSCCFLEAVVRNTNNHRNEMGTRGFTLSRTHSSQRCFSKFG